MQATRWTTKNILADAHTDRDAHAVRDAQSALVVHAVRNAHTARQTTRSGAAAMAHVTTSCRCCCTMNRFRTLYYSSSVG